MTLPHDNTMQGYKQMATKAASIRPPVKESTFTWEGKDRAGKTVRGEMRAGGKMSSARACAVRASRSPASRSAATKQAAK